MAINLTKKIIEDAIGKEKFKEIIVSYIKSKDFLNDIREIIVNEMETVVSDIVNSIEVNKIIKTNVKLMAGKIFNMAEVHNIFYESLKNEIVNGIQEDFYDKYCDTVSKVEELFEKSFIKQITAMFNAEGE